MKQSNNDKGEEEKKLSFTDFIYNLRSVWWHKNLVQDCSLEKENCKPAIL